MQCPNCLGNIGRFELSPNCKHCGVNIYYAQQKKLLTDDAKMCELEYATFRILVAKLKTAFIGGAVQIFRIVAMVLAICAIFVPFATVTAELELFSAKLSFGAFGIYEAFSDGTLVALFNMREYVPLQFWACFALLALMVLIFLVGFAIFVTLLLSFTDIQKTAKVMRGLSVAGVVLCLISVALSLYLPQVINSSVLLNGKCGVGSFACVAVFVLIFALNHLVIKKQLQPCVESVDIRRVEMRKKVKNGEVFLDDLSLPVFESDEERQKRLEAENESLAFTRSLKGGDSNG